MGLGGAPEPMDQECGARLLRGGLCAFDGPQLELHEAQWDGAASTIGFTMTGRHVGLGPPVDTRSGASSGSRHRGLRINVVMSPNGEVRRTGRGALELAGVQRVLQSRAFKRAGVALLVVNVLVFGWSLLARRDPVHNAFWDGWWINLQLLLPTLACVARAVLGGPRRAGAAWLAAATLSFTVASVIFVGWTQFQTNPTLPTPADICYLAFYPCVIAAVFCLLRREAGAPARGLWLDGALGAAGAATGMAAVLSPVLSGSTGDVAAAVMSAA
jgi:hypothetical protein